MNAKPGPEIAMTDLVVRRRRGLMALVATTALGLSAAYLWYFGQAGSGVSLVLGGALGLVAVLHGLAWGDARTPLLVADQTGLRVRLGGDWTGIPWEQVERIEVDERGRVCDGHVAVVASESAGELTNARWRSRLGASVNRWFYDAPLVVPYGLTTTVSAVDMTGALTRLAAGRAVVVRLDEELAEPEPTVAVTRPETPPRERVVKDAAADEAGSGTETGAGAETGADTGPPAKQRLVRRPLTAAAREAAPALPLAKVVAALRSHPARREEVTLPLHQEPATQGTLALSQPYPDEPTEPLPEIEQLRREGTERPARRHRHDDGPVDNVGLIIDATTDLSARAMSRVRRAAPLATSAELLRGQPTAPVVDADDLDDLVIGHTLRAARERLGLSVDELAERTRIRPYVIESIEVDDFRPCGGDFYARGHLRMLARVLGLDPQPLMTAYDDTFASSPIGPRAVFDAELARGTTGMVRGGAAGANWGGLVAAVLVLVLIWGVARYFAEGAATPRSEVDPTENAAGLGSPGPGNKPLPPPQPQQATVWLTAVGGGSRVVVRDRGGGVVWQGVLTDGQSHLSRGDAPLHVMAVDGGVIRLGTQGHRLGFVGAPGEKSRQKITAPPDD